MAQYAPTDPATAVVAVMRLESPQSPEGLKELGSAIEAWEFQLCALAKNTTSQRRREMAAFMQLLPNDIQNIVFQSGSNASTYEEVRDKVKGFGVQPLNREQWTSAGGLRGRAG